MIWVALFDTQRRVMGYVEFPAVPIAAPDDYRCTPEGILSPGGAEQVASELSRGAIHGQVQGYRWYRRVKDPSEESYDHARQQPS